MVKKDKKLQWKIGSAIIIVLFGLMIYFVAWFFYVGSPKEIVSLADQFKPGLDWTLRQEHVEPPRSFCIDVDCPSVSKGWSLSKKIDRQQFENIASIGNSRLTLSDDCFKNEAAVDFCDATGTVNGYEVTLTYTSQDYRDEKPGVSLYIKQR